MTAAQAFTPCCKCGNPLHPDWVACPYCATSAAPAKTKKRPRRSNGTGGVYKRGSTWTARVTVGWHLVNGTPRPVSRTKSGFKTKTEALKYCQTLLDQPVAPKKDITFEALYLRWAEKYEERITKSTMDCYRAAFKHFKPIHHREFAELVNDDLQHCMDTCPAGKRTRENMKALISLLYKYAMDNDIAIRNRAETLYTGNGTKGTRPPFTLAEVEQIRQAIGIVPYADYIYCMIYLGYRPTELLQLEKKDYDAERRCLTGGIKTEAGRDRIVTISPKIQHLVDRQMQSPGPYLFPRLTDHQRMSENYFRTSCFQPAMQELGITDRTPYSCRHTFANLLKAIYGSDTDKAALMGHADASMTKEYQSADYDSLRSLTDRL